MGVLWELKKAIEVLKFEKKYKKMLVICFKYIFVWFVITYVK